MWHNERIVELIAMLHVRKPIDGKLLNNLGVL